MEVWDRKRRQYLCDSVAPDTEDALNYKSYNCMEPPDDLRREVCHNKANKTLIEVLKTDLECGWSSSGKMSNVGFFVVLLPLLVYVVGG